MRKYEGERAQTYEEKRKGNKAWQWQQEIVEDILQRYQPRGVLDVPVGTGRFFEVYKKINAAVLGVDISKDMLKIASEKGYEIPLIQADIFKLQWEWPEFVVSTRFFGHLKSDKKRNEFLAKVTDRLLFSHGPNAYQYIRKQNLTIIETHDFEDGKHCISLVERSRDIHSGNA